MKTHFSNINASLEKPERTLPNYYTAEMEDYLRYYDLYPASGSTEHMFTVFESGRLRLAAHIYKPLNYKATFFVLHGYYNHCGQLNHLIGHLLENDYAVATFDLPGHGLSEGARCEIDDFSQYALALRDFQQTVNPYIEGPRHFLGHSTGASAILQLMSEGGGNDFERIILAAPLIRCTQWDKSKLGYTYNIPFIESVPRIFRENSSDPDYLEFIKNHDPLQFRYVPLSWVKALHQWNENIEQMHIDKRSIEIIQGDSDKIVDWKYNMNFLDEKFPFAQLNIIEGANHDLLNESPALREEVFNLVTASETADCLCCCR